VRPLTAVSARRPAHPANRAIAQPATPGAHPHSTRPLNPGAPRTPPHLIPPGQPAPVDRAIAWQPLGARLQAPVRSAAHGGRPHPTPPLTRA